MQFCGVWSYFHTSSSRSLKRTQTKWLLHVHSEMVYTHVGMSLGAKRSTVGAIDKTQRSVKKMLAKDGNLVIT